MIGPKVDANVNINRGNKFNIGYANPTYGCTNTDVVFIIYSEIYDDRLVFVYSFLRSDI